MMILTKPYIRIVIKKLFKLLWKDNDDENIKEKEYESMPEPVAESGSGQEQEELDRDFDKLDVNQNAILKKQESNEDVEPIFFKINDNENGYLFPDILQIDGGSYVEGMPDYEWVFTVAKENFSVILKELMGLAELSDDVPNELMDYLQKNGTTVTELKEICEAKGIEHYFANYM